VNEDGFALACSLLNKVLDLLCSLVVLVEERLVLRVLPKKRQIHNTNRLPKVANLLARTVNYVRNFVRNDEFQILNTNTKDDATVCVDLLMQRIHHR
jgi:hypothetical protein